MSSPPFRRASSTSSRRVAARVPGPATTTSGASATSATGSSAVSGFTRKRGKRVGLTDIGPWLPISSV